MPRNYWIKKIVSLILIIQIGVPTFLRAPNALAQDSPDSTNTEIAQTPAPTGQASITDAEYLEIQEALNQLERCRNLGVCPAEIALAGAPFRSNYCQLSDRQNSLLSRFFQMRVRYDRLAWAIGLSIATVLAVPGLMSLGEIWRAIVEANGETNIHALSIFVFNLFTASFLFTGASFGINIIRERYTAHFPSVERTGHEITRLRRLWSQQNRQLNRGWLRPFFNQLRRSVTQAGARLRNLRLRSRPVGVATTTTPTSIEAAPSTASSPLSGVRIDVRDDGHGNPCVTQVSAEEAARAFAAELEAAAEASAAGGQQAAVGAGNRSRAVSLEETASHMCSPQRVQQYAQSLAVDRATRWHEFEQRQRRGMALMELADVDRFNQAQRAELIQGGAAAASGVVGGVIVCATGGTATPLVAMGQQLLGRTAVSVATAVALAAGTVSLFPADASAEELTQAQSCRMNAPRVSLPQANATQAYMAIPATIMTERRSPTASYDPARSPMCWVAAADACAALRQEFAGHNIARLTPTACGNVPIAPTPASNAMTPAVPASGIGAH